MSSAAPDEALTTALIAELAGLRGRGLVLVVVSGVTLALHFATWVTSLTLTSVASATALVALQVLVVRPVKVV